MFPSSVEYSNSMTVHFQTLNLSDDLTTDAPMSDEAPPQYSQPPQPPSVDDTKSQTGAQPPTPPTQEAGFVFTPEYGPEMFRCLACNNVPASPQDVTMEYCKETLPTGIVRFRQYPFCTRGCMQDGPPRAFLRYTGLA